MFLQLTQYRFISLSRSLGRTLCPMMSTTRSLKSQCENLRGDPDSCSSLFIYKFQRPLIPSDFTPFKASRCVNDFDMFASVFLVILGLYCCTKESSQIQLDQPRLYGPSQALVGDIINLECEIPRSENDETILLTLYRKDDRQLGDYTLLAGEEKGTFLQVIKADHEGFYVCVASAQNNTEINETVSEAYFLRVIAPVVSAEIVYTGPAEIYEETKLELHCKVASGNHVSYDWFLNGLLVSPSPVHWIGGNRLIVTRVSSKDGGSYMCQAKNVFNETRWFTSNSSDLAITVKGLVSTPDISFTVVKEDDDSYSASITCQSERGDPPISFSLYMGDELMVRENVSERHATFSLPVVLGQHSGWLQCQARNGNQTKYSRWLPLEVVSVAGPVTVQSEYDMGNNYAVIGLRLYCKAAAGTHPRFQWYLNQRPLREQGSFFYVVDLPPEQSVLLLAVGSRSSGKYRCEVWDSFDNSTVMSSKGLYVDKEVLNRLPTLVVAVVFSCFGILIFLVLFCCLSGVVFRWKQSQQKSESSFAMDERLVVSENEMDWTEYNEDPDVAKAPREDELYQEAEASEDEWPEIQQETLDNEADEDSN
ncbi:basement membrane-specific heparan sulfate proteoglycan core protein isoform X2 [Poeciliopsis prolifica]|uniref:basement membrane-specific heparan sulfate proteoglycan core protein isoform X2 n=1 Tax=Poeciliopsis prolifica TaxID=188132 RepID=UPI0024136198|nr:basement membrane-specific heparan sulfate proteoglycan core protein isoform X2 [Poeciliopsis prolifica]